MYLWKVATTYDTHDTQIDFHTVRVKLMLFSDPLTPSPKNVMS